MEDLKRAWWVFALWGLLFLYIPRRILGIVYDTMPPAYLFAAVDLFAFLGIILAATGILLWLWGLTIS